MATILSNTEIVKEIGLPVDIADRLLVEQGTTFAATANEVITALVNKIVYQRIESMTFDNPFKKYDGYPITYGDTIENVYIDRVLGYEFDKDATDPFSKAASNVKSMYAKINYEMQYQVTIEDALLRRAALNEHGFANLVDGLLSRLVTDRSVDEYLATIIALNNSDIYAKGFETVDISTLTDDAEKMGAVTKKIVNVSHDMMLPSIDNNKLGVLNVTPRERLLLIIKQDLLDSINLDYLTGLYNLNKVDMMGTIIPVRSFKAVVNTASGETLTPSEKGDDIDFVIIDTKGFDNHVALQDGGMIYNPKGKYTNHFTNLWKVISYRYDFQARAFKLKRA